MKIFFTAGGTGGHFYPIIAVAEAIHDLTRERKILPPKLYYAAPEPYDREALVANELTFIPTAAMLAGLLMYLPQLFLEWDQRAPMSQ